MCVKQQVCGEPAGKNMNQMGVLHGRIRGLLALAAPGAGDRGASRRRPPRAGSLIEAEQGGAISLHTVWQKAVGNVAVHDAAIRH